MPEGGSKNNNFVSTSSAFGVKTLNINPKSKEKYPLLHQLQNLISQSLSSLWFTYFPYIGSELFSYKYVINQAFLWTETKSWSKQIAKKKRTRLISSHLDRKSMVNKGFIILQKHFALNQEWLFISRAGREIQRCLWHNDLESHLCFCFECLLPLFATPSPTLSEIKKFVLVRSTYFFFLARDESEQSRAGNPERARYGPILPAKLAIQNKDLLHFAHGPGQL